VAIEGLLNEVRWEYIGPTLAVDMPSGSTILELDFAEISAGERVWVGSEGPFIVTENDDEAVTITIESPLIETWEESTNVSPDIGGAPGKRWVAEVTIIDAEEPIEVPLTIHDLAVMPEGPYEQPVTILISDDYQRVIDLPGAQPVISGEYIPPDSLPPAPTPSGGDGGNDIYRQDEPPWPDGTPDMPDNDLWYDTNDNMKPWVWDADNMIWVDASDPKVDEIIENAGDLVVGDSTLNEIAIKAAISGVTAIDAHNLANTADGRISISDYEPTAEDVLYYASSDGGNLLPDGLWRIVQAEILGSRSNLFPNPSFEIDTAGWSGVRAALTRVIPPVVRTPSARMQSGTAVAQLTNDGTANTHYLTLATANRIPVTVGQTITFSAYARLMSGIGGADYTATVWFYDSVGAIVGGVSISGAPVQLPADGTWVRPYVTAVVPATAVTVAPGVSSPSVANADVWQVDAALLEVAPGLDTYIEGTSTGGVARLTLDDVGGMTMPIGGLIVVTRVGAPYDGTWTVSSFSEVAPWTVSYHIAEAADPAHAVDGVGANTLIKGREPGSMWYTRTRARQNHCSNPSFELDLAGWTSTGTGTFTRELTDVSVPIPGTGTHDARALNTAAAELHSISWDGGIPGFPVSEGQSWAITVFARLESGSGVGSYVSLRYYDAAAGLVEHFNSPPVTLLTDEWVELKVAAPVPSGGIVAYLGGIQVVNPNASAVWRINAALIEQEEATGRYFDGDSYDAVWDGAPHASTSHLVGGKITAVYELYDGAWLPLDFTGSTQYDSDASDLTTGILDPDRIAYNSLPPYKLLTNSMRVSDAVRYGMLVNTWDNNGVFFVRPAQAGAMNLLPNPSIETDASGYIASNATIARSTSFAADGVASLLITPNGATVNSSAYIGVSAGMPSFLVPGRTYTISGTIRVANVQTGSLSAAARNIWVYITSPSNNGGVQYTVPGVAAANAVGTYRVSVTVTLPGDTTSALIRIFNGSNIPTELVYWDALMVEASSVLSPYHAGTIEPHEAHGFVLEDAEPGDAVPVFTLGYVPALVGLQPGLQFLQTQPGQIGTKNPNAVGQIVQQVGFASDETTFHFHPQQSYLLR
jgi:hypothetical protein